MCSGTANATCPTCVKLDDDRASLFLNGILADKVASGEDSTEQIEFGSGFGGITDLQVGPDGHLYACL
jgi:aldose sugar dehydrogenase